MIVRKTWFNALLLSLASFTTSYAQSTTGDAQDLVNRWLQENGTCRGSSGPDTLSACDRRQTIGQQLYAMGYCYGKQGEFGYQMQWHPCNPTSTRPERAQAQLGPSFDCGAPSVATQPLAQLICSSDDLSKAEMSYVIAYQALRHSMDDSGRRRLASDANGFAQGTAAACNIQRAGKLNRPPSSQEALCIKERFEAQRLLLLGRMQGHILEEAKLTPEDALAIQKKLQSKGLLPVGATVDGIFGPATRTAIEEWQRSVGQRVTGFASLAILNGAADTAGPAPQQRMSATQQAQTAIPTSPQLLTQTPLRQPSPNPFSSQLEPRLYRKYEELQQQHLRDMQQLQDKAEQRLQALRSGQGMIPAQAGRTSRDRNPYFEIGSQTAPAAETAAQRRDSERKDQAIKLAKQEMARQEEEWMRERERLDKIFSEQVLLENQRTNEVERQRRQQVELQIQTEQRERERVAKQIEAEQRAKLPPIISVEPSTNSAPPSAPPRGQIAQGLPGPAARGWFVLMGPTEVVAPTGSFDGKEWTAENAQAYRSTMMGFLEKENAACMAVVVEEDKNDLPSVQLPDPRFFLYGAAMMTKRRFGPFRSFDDAIASLQKAGWTHGMYNIPWLFVARSGC